MVTKRQYIEYLVSTPTNYTCTHLADHLEGVSHDAVTDYLARAKLTARQLWELAAPLLQLAVPPEDRGPAAPRPEIPPEAFEVGDEEA